MACKSGCCNLPAGAPPPSQSPALVSATPPMQDKVDSCCNASNSSSDRQTYVPVAEDGCCVPLETMPAGCHDACCKESSEKPDVEDDCCKPKQSTVAASENANCRGIVYKRDAGTHGNNTVPMKTGDDCCASSKADSTIGCVKSCGAATKLKSPVVADSPALGCCENKASPCCDESCLERVALRECESHGLKAPLDSGCGKRENNKPCAEHTRNIRSTYTETLEALGCICRALIALGQESCCVPPRRSKDLSAPLPRSVVEVCCAAEGNDNSSCSAKGRPGSQTKLTSIPKTGADPVQLSAANFTEAAQATADIEMGNIASQKEHVILSISGMTCTGCETKLIRTLDTHQAVTSLKTSLALSRAEFDLVGPTTVLEVIKHLERTTEFTCERVTNQGSSLDILVPVGSAAAFVDQPWPKGVTEVRVVDKKTVNVSFDSKIIGARDLVERGWSDGVVRLAPLRAEPTLEAGNKHVRHTGYMTLLSACLTIPVLVMAWAPLPNRPLEYGSASLALATLVQFAIAGPFYPRALKALFFSKVVEMDLLVVMSTSTAYIFSVVSFAYMVIGQPLSTGEFFETSTLLVTLIMVGRWVTALARQKAVQSISIRSLQTPAALLMTDNGDVEIDARLLQYGDVFKVVPDSKIPTDGTVISGSSEVDESMITGESKPVEKQNKSPVTAGSVNGFGTLQVRLTRLPGENTISKIAGMVDEAKLSKPKIQDLADRVASYFVPVVICLTIVTFCIWTIIGIKVRGHSGSEATIQAITYAITVLIVSCPCAVGLAVPMVVIIASGVAAERGVIFKSAEAIEVMYKTSHVVFDKTGTITEGKLAVTREWYTGSDKNFTKSLLLGLVESIRHPVSAAVAKHLKSQGVLAYLVNDSKTAAGKGVEGTAQQSGLVLQAGNSRWLNLTEDIEVQSVLSQGQTAFCFKINGVVAAVFGLKDSIRADSFFTVNNLLSRGISVHMISGDDDAAVRSVAAQLNIPEMNIRSRCSPADKQAYIQDLLERHVVPDPIDKSKNPQHPVVVFCGDGTNDAVALAQATVGVHINEGGTDVAQSAADVVLMRPDLSGILVAIAVSKMSIRRIIFNFGWSFVYNLFAILLAAGAFVNVRIPPEFAGLGELVSVLPVVTAATLLRWTKIRLD